MRVVLLHKRHLCLVRYNLLVLVMLVELVLQDHDQVVVEVELELRVLQDQEVLVELVELVNLYHLYLDQVLNLIIQEYLETTLLEVVVEVDQIVVRHLEELEVLVVVELWLMGQFQMEVKLAQEE